MFIEIETRHLKPGEDEVRTSHLVNLDRCFTITKDKDPTKLAFVGLEGTAIVGIYKDEQERDDMFNQLAVDLQITNRDLLNQLENTADGINRLSENIWQMRNPQ